MRDELMSTALDAVHKLYREVQGKPERACVEEALRLLAQAAETRYRTELERTEK